MRVTVISGTMICLTAWSCAARAQPLPAQEAALAELTSLRVELQLIGAAQSIGLIEQALTETVEDRLHSFGLSVRDGSDDNLARGDPRLRVAIQTVNAAGGYAFLVSVQLVKRVINYRRYVELVFDGVLPTSPTDSVESLELSSGIKWEAQALGTSSRENATSFISNALLDYVDRFLEEYRSVGAQ